MTARVIIVGAGIVGAATAYFTARAGLDVVVLDSGRPGAGTSSHGEGNLLVSDKVAGPELDLARYSNAVWADDLGEYGPLWEYEPKGGVVVASDDRSAAALQRLVGEQTASGIEAGWLDAAAVREREPHISPAVVAGAWYPADAQLQPMLAVAHLLRLAREHGAEVRAGVEVTGVLRREAECRGVKTPAGPLRADAVINAAGPWSPRVAELAGVDLPIRPRRGFVLVTQPLPPLVRHKVYSASYVGDVGSSDAGLANSPVVEGTPSGPILIGSSRERVGFDATPSAAVLSRMAQAARDIFPFLGRVRVMRHYHGFRPYSPDHLPVLGPDPRVPGLWHATGHEGAGIGLAAGTGKLLAQALAGIAPDLPLDPYAPTRFEEVAA